MVIKPQFADGQFSFHEGLASVAIPLKEGEPDFKGGSGFKYGFIDKTGKVVIKPQWETAWDFKGGIARVSFPDDTINYINRDGKYIWKTSKMR